MIGRQQKRRRRLYTRLLGVLALGLLKPKDEPAHETESRGRDIRDRSRSIFFVLGTNWRGLNAHVVKADSD